MAEKPIFFNFCAFAPLHFLPMKKLILILFIFATNAQAQTITDSIWVENGYRSFHYLKNEEAQTKKKLLFILHGSGGTGMEMVQASAGLHTAAVLNSTIIVYANGYKKYWNECRKASTAAANVLNINENLYFEKMIAYFAANYGIDTNQVMVIGFSGGGQMAYKLAMTMPEKIRSICSIVANLPTTENFDCVAKDRPVAVMVVNGTEDGVNPYNGGKINAGNIVLGNVRSTDETIGYWAKVNGYKPSKRPKTETITNTASNTKLVKISYQNPKKMDVLLYKIVGGKHELPKSFDVFCEALAFFDLQATKKK